MYSIATFYLAGQKKPKIQRKNKPPKGDNREGCLRGFICGLCSSAPGKILEVSNSTVKVVEVGDGRDDIHGVEYSKCCVVNTSLLIVL